MRKRTIKGASSAQAPAVAGGGGAPALIAHRGASLDAPENTLAAFQLAWQQDADGIEGDVHLTRDGHIVCIHDATTQRTAGRNARIADATFAELRRLDVGAWKGRRWRGERIPTLPEVLATVPRGKHVFIELKCGPEILPALEQDLAAAGRQSEQVVILAFDANVVAEAKRLLPRIRACWVTDLKIDTDTGSVRPSAAAVLATLETIHADGVDCRAQAMVDPAFVRRLRAARKELHVWTVDDVATAKRCVRLGVDSLTSNRAGWLKQRLRRDATASPPPASRPPCDR